uniref:EARP complex and GARP complex interacting protein 1 n=1 Tax=Eptatretus burgeri TaxID=7764 RepID=A0A8C4Q1V3_EPTBU
MDDDAPVIYGIEFQARTLTAQTAETDAIRFIVGTQSLKHDNQVHLIDFDDENNLINKTVFFHHIGEIWHISASPADLNILSTCYNTCVDGKLQTRAAVWRIPRCAEVGEAETGEDAGANPLALDLLCHLESNNQTSTTSSVLWEPMGDGTKVITLADNHLLCWDLKESSTEAVLSNSLSVEGKGQLRFTSGRWSPHHHCCQVATANDTTIRGWDIRTMSQVYCIDNAHGQLVRDLDFNPNKQYCLASCGDDCRVKFWDTRNTTKPMKMLEDHSHWVWSVRYNHAHDQLVLSSSSDSRVILSNMASISSEPFGPAMDEDDEDEEGTSEKRVDEKREPLADSIIATYEEHEDSVYAVEWSSADPWLFASLSYDGRLVINRVPRTVKYNILL